jgi:hypothetical protein
MDSNELAKRIAARLNKQTVQQVGILSHIPDEEIQKIIGFANGHTQFTDEENQAIFDGLRAAETWGEAYEAVHEYGFNPAWAKWWAWLTIADNWSKVEQDVERERGCAERARQYEAKQEAGIIPRTQIGWSSVCSEKVIRMWDVVQALRMAFDTGVGLPEASEQWYAALDSDGGDWWDHVLGYAHYKCAVGWLYIGLNNWRDEKEGRLDPSYRTDRRQTARTAEGA